jgi:hypothetical protein
VQLGQAHTKTDVLSSKGNAIFNAVNAIDKPSARRQKLRQEFNVRSNERRQWNSLAAGAVRWEGLSRVTKGADLSPMVAPCSKRYKKICVAHHEKCRPEEWRSTAIPQSRCATTAGGIFPMQPLRNSPITNPHAWPTEKSGPRTGHPCPGRMR